MLREIQSGYWKNGRAAMYEIRNAAEGITLSCIAYLASLKQRKCAMKRYLRACMVENDYTRNAAQSAN